MFFPQKVVEDIVVSLTCCIPQSCPTILCDNLRKKMFHRKKEEKRSFTSGEAPLSTKSLTTSRNPALAAQ